MKRTGYSLIPQTGSERDDMAVFKGTVENYDMSLYMDITAMGGSGERVVMAEIGEREMSRLETMYAELNREANESWAAWVESEDYDGKPRDLNDDTIGNGLHWREGEYILGYIFVVKD